MLELIEEAIQKVFSFIIEAMFGSSISIDISLTDAEIRGLIAAGILYIIFFSLLFYSAFDNSHDPH